LVAGIIGVIRIILLRLILVSKELVDQGINETKGSTF
jgi:hypothetical protein